MKRIITLGTVSLLGLCFGGILNPAHAGYWEVEKNPYNQYGPPTEIQDWLAEAKLRMDGSDTTTGYDSSPSVNSNFNYSIDWTDLFDVDNGMHNETGAETGPLTIHKEGKIRAKFHWVSYGANDTPTDSINVILSFDGYLGALTDDSGTIFRDTSQEQVAASIDGEAVDLDIIVRVPMDPNTEEGTTGTFHKRILLTIPTNGSAEVWSPWININTLSYAGALSNTWHRVVNDLRFTPIVDSRQLQLTSSIEPSYHKGANGERELNIPNENGSMSADTVSYWSDFFASWTWNGASFHADLSGDPWDEPEYTWAGGLVGTQQPNVPIVSAGTYLGNGSTPTSSSSVGVSVQDTDERNLTGTYVVRFHQQAENAEIYNTVHEAYQDYLSKPDHPVSIFTNPVDQVATTGGGVPFTYTYNNTFWATVANDGVTNDALKYVGDADVPLISMICKDVGIVISEYNSTNGSDVADFDNLWGKEHSLLEDSEVPSSSWPAAALMPYYRMRPIKLVGHTLNYIHYDAYGEDGFIGTKNMLTETFDGRLETAGNYHYYTNPF